jgi:glyoxylase-like metal-dependent hydrolase (beta-lactamase superfamily II)
MIETVAPGLVRLALRTPTLPPATATNTVIVVGEKVAVIEPGTPHRDEQERLDAELDQLAASGRPLAAVLLTHHHGDHIGYAQALARARGVPIHAHDETAARVGFAVERPLGDGDVVDLGAGAVIRAVFTPGHAPGHLLFIDERSRIAHVGDLVASEGTILIDPHDGGDMVQYLASLRKLASLDLAAIVPAHGPVLHEPVAVAEHYVRHRLAREAKVLAALATPATMQEIVERAYDDTPRGLWPIALRSAEAHLRKLLVDGVAVVDQGVWRRSGL